MALVDNAWYVNFGNGSSTGYYGLTVWSTGTVTTAGTIRRQLAAPAVGNERVFVCVVAGTTHPTTEPTWTLTRGAKTTDNVVTWQECTGIAALNGDATNTPSWTITATPPGGVKGTAVTLGQVIKRDNGASYQICTTAGTAGSGAEPSFSDTAGTTTNDNTAVWTSLGVVGNFTGWQAPHARLANALASTWGQIGNSFYIGDNHAETQAAAMFLTSPSNGGTAGIGATVLCVDRAGSLPPVSADLKTTGSITTTGANALDVRGTYYFYGLAFNCSTGATAASLAINNFFGGWQKFQNCSLNVLSTNTGSRVQFGHLNAGNNASRTTLIGTTLGFANASQSVELWCCSLEWLNTTSAVTGTMPTSFLTMSSTILAVGPLKVRGVDLSPLGTATLVVAPNAAGRVEIVDCKLGASAVIATAPTNRSGVVVDLIRGDSGATNYRTERYSYEGVQTTETTIVRTGGATDGTTTVSWKIVSTANSRWVEPYESLPIAIWNDSTSAITTLTIYGTTTGGGVPKDDEIWVEVEYLGSALTPQGSFITTTKASVLAASAATNNSSDASTWGGGGAGNGFKIVVPSFTPGMKGPINIIVKAAKASSTYYIDPKPVVN